MDLDVRELLARGQRDRAFEKVLELYETKVFRMIYSMVGDVARAEEVCQDAFLKVWEALEGFDAGRSAIGTWVYTIARNTALSHLRAQAYRRTVPLESIAEPAAGAGREEDADLKRMVEKLPEELREATVLYYYQERSVEEVARMLDIPEGTVKSHLWRARKMLAEAMKGVELR